ncbi:hypothetical protein EBV26_05885, partial [bacterium]|nr:hypothetical protein [bacterium]
MNHTAYHYLLSGLLFLTMNFSLISQEIRATIDVKNIKDDKVHVKLMTPKMSVDEILYIMPASIPGTYAKMDFGYFVKNFKA